MKQIRQTILSLLLLSVITGLVYPLAVTGIAQILFPAQANGSLIVQDGRRFGSELIGQPFSEPGYFWGRLSATGPSAYNAGASSGSNQGPLNPALREKVDSRIKALKEADPGNALPVPVDLVTASGSGLDPHISIAAAEYQINRVARIRGMGADSVRAMVRRFTEPRQLGFLGEPRVNVLRLNLALDGVGSNTREGL